MKGRFWIPLAIVSFLLLIGGYFAASRILHLERKTREYLIQRVSAELGAEFEISAISVSPWFVGFRDVRLHVHDTPLVFEAKRVRIGYNLLALIRSGFKPLSGTEQIFLDRPRLIWSLDHADSTADPFNPDRIPELPIARLPRMLVDISDGVFLVERGGVTVEIARRIGGWLDGRNGSLVELRLEANLLSRSRNTTCTGSLDRDAGSAVFDLRTESGDLSRDELKPICDRLSVESGTFDCSLHLVQRNGKIDWNGAYALKQCTFRLRDTEFGADDLSITGRISREDVSFDTASGSMWGIKPRIRGNLLLAPKFHLQMLADAEDIDLSEFFSHLVPDLEELPVGTADAEIRLAGPLDSLVAEASFSAPDVAYRKQRFGSVEIRLKADPGLLRIERVGATFSGYRLSGDGTIFGSPGGKDRRLRLALTAADTREAGREYRLRLSGSTDTRNKTVSADYDFSHENVSDRLPRHLSGKAALRGEDLTFSCINTNAAISGKIAGLYSRPRVNSRVTLTRFPVLEYVGAGGSDLLLNGNLDLEGTLESMTLSGALSLSGPHRLQAGISGKAQITAPVRPERKINAELRVEDLRVEHSAPNTLRVSLRSDSTATSATVIDERENARMMVRAAHDSGALSGMLRLQGYPLERIIAIFKDDEFNYHGRITGAVHLAGTVSDPRFSSSMPIRIEAMNFDSLDRLSGMTGIAGRVGELRFTGAEVQRDGKPIVRGEGVWVSGSPFILNAGGEGFELGAIGDIISKDRACDGAADYRVRMEFTRNSGTIEGDFTVRNGHFLDVPFDSATGRLGGGSRGFEATGFRVSKAGLYTGNGSATSGFIWKDDSGGRGLELKLELQGNLVRAVPHLTTAIRAANGDCTMQLTLGGSWQEPVIVDGRLSLARGIAEPSFLVDRVSGISAELAIDPEIRTASGFKAIRVISASGAVNGKKITVQNVFQGQDFWEQVKRPELVHVVNSVIGLDFGVFTARMDRGRGRDRGLELHVPGFMKRGQTARFELAEERGGFFVVGASPHDDKLTPYLGSTVRVLSGDIAWPLIVDPNEPPGDPATLGEIFWDMDIYAGSSVYYVNEFSTTINETSYRIPYTDMKIPLAGATISRTMAKLDERSTFSVTGRMADGSFRVIGDARSSSGTVSWVGVEFDIEIVEFGLDTARLVKPALLTARAKTMVYDDSTGVESTIYLKVNAVDAASGKRREAIGRADAPNETFGEMSSELSMVVDAQELGFLEIQFTSTNPADNTREKVLARLGISTTNIGGAAGRALAQGVDDYYLNFMRPLEHMLRKYSGLDVVRFTPSVIGNLVRSRLATMDRFSPDSDYMLFDGSRIMLGEYFMDGFFLTYRGQYGLTRDFLRRKERGFYHELALQYLLQRDTRLQFNYNYDNSISKSDRRIEIRHDFEF